VIGRRRREDVEVHGTDVDMSPDRWVEHAQLLGGRDPLDDGRTRHRITQRPGEDLGYPPPAHQPGETADVVEVEVAEDEQRNLVDAEVPQAAVDRHGVWSGVDRDR
jgi:hypothetical protein